MGTNAPDRFIRRTWHRTSEKICAANELPPGFRIVLVGVNGRSKRDDLVVRSGSFGAYPSGMVVSHFVEEALRNEVRSADLSYAYAELRDHRNVTVCPDLPLRAVRDMSGDGGRRAKVRLEQEDLIYEIGYEVEDALGIFDDDPRLQAAPNNDVLLKALVRHMLSQFDFEAIEHVLSGEDMKAAKARAG